MKWVKKTVNEIIIKFTIPRLFLFFNCFGLNKYVLHNTTASIIWNTLVDQDNVEQMKYEKVLNNVIIFTLFILSESFLILA